jgi:formylglycine-generating enzyme required for sulfatase activity/predicted Ser/Thr protein kinase
MEEDQMNCSQCGMEMPGDVSGKVCPVCSKLDQESAPYPGHDFDATTVDLHRDGSAKLVSGDWLEDATWLREALPDYELIGEIGRGGMGRVLKAKHIGLDRMAAIKVLSVDLGQHDAFIKRFQREARAMAKLRHPNIVQIYDYGQREEACYIVMEFVDGVDLRHMIREKNLAPEQALAIVPQICDALQYAHDQGVIHRDIKPGNIMVASDGVVKVADFGLAKVLHGDSAVDATLTLTGKSMGTPAYMAPEQEEDVARVDHRADIYSLGVMFYEMLTGERPSGLFKPPSSLVQVDGRIDEVVLKSMEQNPEKRYQQVSEIKTAVNCCSQVRKKPARSKVRHGRTLATLTVGVLLFGMGWWQRDRVAEVFATREVEPMGVEASVIEEKLPSDLRVHLEDEPISVVGLAAGSKEVQDRQLLRAKERGYPIGVKSAKLGMRLQFIPGGTFTMGGDAQEHTALATAGGNPRSYDDELPQTEVTLSDFWMATFELTQAQATSLLGLNPSSFKNAGPNAPVENITWEEAQQIAEALCLLEGVPKGTYRLPSEAEWEYACRAGTTTMTYAGNLDILGKHNAPRLDAIAWYGGNSGANFDGAQDSSDWEGKQMNHSQAGPHEVGQKKPNAYGLYDTIGNVWEWCADWHGSYPGGAHTNPRGPASGSERVDRGGSWSSRAESSRAADRYKGTPQSQYDTLGVRLLRTVE